MQIRLYMDEDVMSRALVNGLRARGIDVATVGGEGKAANRNSLLVWRCFNYCPLSGMTKIIFFFFAHKLLSPFL
jgi:hypothetical protein